MMQVSSSQVVKVFARVVWPLYLAAYFVVYGLADKPTHLLFWHATRRQHAALYFGVALVILVSLGRTPKKLLMAKLVLVITIAWSSAFADLVIDHPTGRAWKNAVTWVGLIIANMVAILLRVSWKDERGRA